MSFQRLKERQRAEREGYTEGLSLRVHRALSWLQRAEQCEDNDSRFIFLWIAFNAAYAFEIDETLRLSEQESFKLFLEKTLFPRYAQTTGSFNLAGISWQYSHLVRQPICFPKLLGISQR